MFDYSISKQLDLGLKKKPLTKGQYQSVLSQPKQYGVKTLNPAISVVVVAYNEELEEFIGAFDRIFSQKTSEPFEVVLIDNGLRKSIKNRLKQYNVLHVVMKKNVGCSAGRNVGSLFAEAPILGFVDADGFVNEYFIKNALAAMSRYNTAVRGKVLPKTSGSDTPPSYDLGDKSFSYYINAEGISVWNKKSFIKTGGFEDVLYGGEGVVLQNRMIEIYDLDPGSFGYDPAIVLYHDYNNDPRHFKEKQTRYEIITRKIHTRYPFLTSMIAAYNSQTASLVPKIPNKQRHVQAKIERIRLSVGSRFGHYYRSQYKERLDNPNLVNGSQKNPLFSVVIPCYNVGTKLNRAVESALRQTIPSLEVIVVDDLSTDKRTINVLKSLEDRVKVLYRNQNGGVAAARNTGISSAKAPYVLCLDGDDTIEMDYLEEAFNVFESSQKVGLVSSWVRAVGARSGEWRPADKIVIPQALLASPVPTATCFRKETWSKVGGYDESMRGYEDWNYWICVMKQGLETRVLPRHHFNYTISPTSKVHTSNKNSLDLVGRIFDNHEELFQEHDRFVITHKYRDYAILRSEHIQLKALHGDSNTILNLFRFNRYPDYLKRAVKKFRNLIRILWETKDPLYVASLIYGKVKLYAKTFLRKTGLRT